MGGRRVAGQYAAVPHGGKIGYAAPMDRDRSAKPNTIPWPPLIYAGAAVLALVLHHAAPLPAWWVGAHWPAVRLLGVALMVGGVVLDLWAMFTMWRARANIMPHRAATALVSHGPFAWSRNPIYLGNTCLLLGAGLAFAIAWFIPAALLAAALASRLAIVREEAHLNARFGHEWRDYRLRVKRWLGRRSTGR